MREMNKFDCDTCKHYEGIGWGSHVCENCTNFDKYESNERTKGGFEQRGQQIGALVDSKQAQYGDAVSASHKVMLELFPQGVPVDKLGDMLLIVRIIDKLCRLTRGNGEGGEDAWADIAGYGLLGMRHREQVESVEQMNTNESETTRVLEKVAKLPWWEAEDIAP